MNPFHSPQVATLMALLPLAGMHRPQQLLLMLCIRHSTSVGHVGILKRTRLNQLPVPLPQKPQVSSTRPQAMPLDIVLHARSSSKWSVTILVMIGLYLCHLLLPSLQTMIMRLCGPCVMLTIEYALHSFYPHHILISISDSDCQNLGAAYS